MLRWGQSQTMMACHTADQGADASDFALALILDAIRNARCPVHGARRRTTGRSVGGELRAIDRLPALTR
jgi:hypothetical protein